MKAFKSARDLCSEPIGKTNATEKEIMGSCMFYSLRNFQCDIFGSNMDACK